MKIALLGYGKMGKAIEKMAIEQGHSIVLKVGRNLDYDLSEADVAIDFSIPELAVTHISNALNAGVPIVSGTTGWLNDFDTMTTLCSEKKGAFLYASNFSVGVNIFFALNKKLAQLTSNQNYSASLEEIHHTQKLDAPSGTAISLAQDIIDVQPKFTQWDLHQDKSLSVKADSLPIISKRIGNVPGTHSITYENKIDQITITHEAHSRAGFVQGALLAATWLVGKKGVFSMQDVLNIS